MNHATKCQLKRTHGRTGQPIMPAIVDEDPDELGAQPVELPPERTVDGDRTSLHTALLDAIAAATTWRV